MALGLTLREHPVTVAPLHTRVVTWDSTISPTYRNTFVLDDLPAGATVAAQLTVSADAGDSGVTVQGKALSGTVLVSRTYTLRFVTGQAGRYVLVVPDIGQPGGIKSLHMVATIH